METLPRNPYLWKQAKTRAKFQAGLLTFLFVNALLWVIWAFTASHHGRHHHFDHFIPWPLWVTFFWGLGLLKQGLVAYGGLGMEQRTQREYERLHQQHLGSADPLDKYR